MYLLPTILESPNLGQPVNTVLTNSDEQLVLEVFGQPLDLIRHWQATFQLLTASAAALEALPASLSTLLEPQFFELYGKGNAFSKLSADNFKGANILGDPTQGWTVTLDLSAPGSIHFLATLLSEVTKQDRTPLPNKAPSPSEGSGKKPTGQPDSPKGKADSQASTAGNTEDDTQVQNDRQKQQSSSSSGPQGAAPAGKPTLLLGEKPKQEQGPHTVGTLELPAALKHLQAWTGPNQPMTWIQEPRNWIQGSFPISLFQSPGSALSDQLDGIVLRVIEPQVLPSIPSMFIATPCSCAWPVSCLPEPPTCIRPLSIAPLIPRLPSLILPPAMHPTRTRVVALKFVRAKQSHEIVVQEADPGKASYGFISFGWPIAVTLRTAETQNDTPQKTVFRPGSLHVIVPATCAISATITIHADANPDTDTGLIDPTNWSPGLVLFFDMGSSEQQHDGSCLYHQLTSQVSDDDIELALSGETINQQSKDRALSTWNAFLEEWKTSVPTSPFPDSPIPSVLQYCSISFSFNGPLMSLLNLGGEVAAISSELLTFPDYSSDAPHTLSPDTCIAAVLAVAFANLPKNTRQGGIRGPQKAGC